MSFQPDYYLHCRNCNVIFENEERGRRSVYCSTQCSEEWNKGYMRRKQREHRAGVRAKLRRLEAIENGR